MWNTVTAWFSIRLLNLFDLVLLSNGLVGNSTCLLVTGFQHVGAVHVVV